MEKTRAIVGKGRVGQCKVMPADLVQKVDSFGGATRQPELPVTDPAINTVRMIGSPTL